MNEHTAEQLKELQQMDMHSKVMLTQARIIEFYGGYHEGMEYGGAYVSFSGGKDSTVLLHIARQIYPDIPAVFCNTGLEYPEIRQFAQAHKNVTMVKPKTPFREVISKYGYPLISKNSADCIYYARGINGRGESMYKRKCLLGMVENRRSGRKSEFNIDEWLPLCNEAPFKISAHCCGSIKKAPLKAYAKETKRFPIVATMADESRARRAAWIKSGCNSFDGAEPVSKPLSFWTEQDVLQYIVENGLGICSVYGEIVAKDEDDNEYDPRNLLTEGCKLMCTGLDRTGCIYCGFGAHLEKGETRFQRLAKTHPKQYEFCMGGGQWVDNPAYDPTAPKMDGAWQNWNPKRIWVPSKKGLGLSTVFRMVNEIYGRQVYRYE